MTEPQPIALVDVKNMYVSCEQLFDLSLRGKAVCIWSNGDGCAVARSDEAKALGIKMGTPKFKLRQLLENGSLIGRSSNYCLYGDMCRRKQEVYADYTPKTEVYSVDESFLDFSGFHNAEDHARALIRAVDRRVGLPVRVGLGSTKTLAKAANEIAKKNPICRGAFDMVDTGMADWALARMDVSDVWGVGRATTRKLRGLGISTAAQLRDMPIKQARAVGTVVLERTVRELQGERCIAFEDLKPTRKGVAVTRTAGQPIRDFGTLMEALTCHATRAAEKLRHHDMVAARLRVFYHTSRFRTDAPQHSVSRTAALMPMTNDTLDLVNAARRCAQAGWLDGHPFAYSKVGIMCEDLIKTADRPRTLFDPIERRDPRLMGALDHVNDRYGRKTLTLASEGHTKRKPGSWWQRADDHSPRYTTRLSDLPKLRQGRLVIS